jgi:hypothetical protein
MRIQTITIGEYSISPAIPFCLYQFPSQLVTPPYSNTEEQQQSSSNYFCIQDLFAIFDLHLIKHDLIESFKQNPVLFCKNSDNSSFIQTHVMAEIALKNNLYNLADLCRLNDQDLLFGAAIPLLKVTTFVRLNTKPLISIINGFQPTAQLNGNEWFFLSNNEQAVKLEPLSPPIISR